MLVVDPATGAMYKLDNDGINEVMDKSAETSASLNIINKDQVPEGWEERLVKIN